MQTAGTHRNSISTCYSFLFKKKKKTPQKHSLSFNLAQQDRFQLTVHAGPHPAAPQRNGTLGSTSESLRDNLLVFLPFLALSP